MMKKNYALLFFMLVSFFGTAQPSYYVLPAIDIGYNPGGLNTDLEEPAEPGWTNVMTSTSTNSWSSSQSIPFSFQFGGSSVSSFVVSNTGVLTFNASPGTAPGTNNISLPSLDIPNQSICAWGLTLTGSNDKIRSKTFGSAPNRQLWIQWTSASAPDLTGASRETYWSIVLEEGTDKVYIVDQRTYDENSNEIPTGNNVSLTLGVQVSSTDYREVSASPNVASHITDGGTANDPSDNSYYEFIQGTPPSYDLEGAEIDMPEIVEANKGHYISGIFRNVGTTDITTADFNYRINGGSVVSLQSVGNLPVNVGQFKALSSPTQWTPTTSGAYTVQMWMSNLNGNPDQNIDNDTITAQVVVTDNPPPRKVVIEERTGTWCGWCPRGFVGMQYMEVHHHETAIPIAVHNNDPMALPAYDNYMVGNFPAASVDRLTHEVNPTGSALEGVHNSRTAIIPVASVDIKNINYNSGSGSIEVDVQSEFVAERNSADYRYVLVLTEDGVTGTSSGYAQANTYSGSSDPLVDINGFDYNAAPDPVPASDMVYPHVARAIVPSFHGAPGSVPTNIAAQQKVNYTFNTSLPGSVLNENHVHITVMLLDNSTGEVINANNKKLTNVVDLDETDLVKANVYPNPASGHFKLELFESTDFNVEMINAMGQKVLSQSFRNRDQAIINTKDLATGMYILNVTSGNKMSSINMAITR